MSESKNDLDLAFEEFESEVGENKVIRKELISGLRKVIANPEMEISPYDKSMQIQSKLMVFKTLDDLLKSAEDITIKKIKMKLSRKSDEVNGAVGATIIQLLKNIRADGEQGGGENNNTAEAMDLIKKRAEEINNSGDAKAAQSIKVSDGEIEECQKIERNDRPEDEPSDD